MGVGGATEFELGDGSLHFLVGIGPEVVRISTPKAKATYLGGQAALDFMYWPSRRVGLWVEPNYELIFRNPVSHGIGGTGGLLIGW